MASSDPPKDEEPNPNPTLSPTTKLWNFIQDFADEQNMARLKDCEQLTDILKACQARGSSSADSETQQHYEQVPPLDQIGLGKRWMKYHGWHELPIANRKGCIPEQHALWACRASSLRCGQDLHQMRHCFKEQGNEVILGQRKTAYEHGKKEAVREQIPCYELQRTVGKCVAQNAKKMEQRKNDSSTTS